MSKRTRTATVLRPPPEAELYAEDYPTRYFARLDLMLRALEDPRLKRELIGDEMAIMLHRFARYQCRARADIPNDDPNKLQLPDFVLILRGLNYRKRAIEAWHA